MEKEPKRSKPSRGDIALIVAMGGGWLALNWLHPIAALQKPWSADLSELVRLLLPPVWAFIAFAAAWVAFWVIRRNPKRTVSVATIATIVALGGFVPLLKLTRDAETQAAQRELAASIADKASALQDLKGKELETAARSLVRDMVFEMTGEYPSKPMSDTPLDTSTKEISQ